MTSKIFDLKEISAGAILHQLLLCPCDCHQPIFAYFNLAVIVMMNDNAGCEDDVCRWCYLGCRVKWRIPGRTLPPAASFASRHLHFYLSSFSHCCVFASTRHLLHSLPCWFNILHKLKRLATKDKRWGRNSKCSPDWRLRGEGCRSLSYQFVPKKPSPSTELKFIRNDDDRCHRSVMMM